MSNNEILSKEQYHKSRKGIRSLIFILIGGGIVLSILPIILLFTAYSVTAGDPKHSADTYFILMGAVPMLVLVGI